MGLAMKKFGILSFLVLVILFSIYKDSSSELDEYIVIAWNDLGMHCANKDFSTLVVLPPYNNVLAQVIKRGSESSFPQVVTENVKVTYEIPGNTYSVGKTNFWDYAKSIFGVDLQDNIGLTGNGLSGDMTADGDHFIATGIPITPYTDDNLETEDPFQQVLVKVFDMDGKLLATANPVIPVSNEIGCVSGGCHNSEQGIINSHEREDGYDPNDKPILCAKCHASPALGTQGNSEARPLSYRIHRKHASRTSDCYKCHPGQNTQCFRGVMKTAGHACQDCHGDMNEVANSITSGRTPWMEEPSCDKSGCHDVKFAPNDGKLFKDSQGHGGLYCSACHGSPHAIYPSELDRDNEQIINLQGYAGKLTECWVCHGYDINAAGPHGMINTSVSEDNIDLKIYPNPVNDYMIINGIDSEKELHMYNSIGKEIRIADIKSKTDQRGIKLDLKNLTKGSYLIRNGKATVKFIKN